MSGTIFLSVYTTVTYSNPYLNSAVYGQPYQGQGIALIIVGIILIVLSQLLHREYKFRIKEKEAIPTVPIPS